LANPGVIPLMNAVKSMEGTLLVNPTFCQAFAMMILAMALTNFVLATDYSDATRAPR
jgi:hypothetical protein